MIPGALLNSSGLALPDLNQFLLKQTLKFFAISVYHLKVLVSEEETKRYSQQPSRHEEEADIGELLELADFLLSLGVLGSPSWPLES